MFDKGRAGRDKRIGMILTAALIVVAAALFALSPAGRDVLKQDADAARETPDEYETHSMTPQLLKKQPYEDAFILAAEDRTGAAVLSERAEDHAVYMLLREGFEDALLTLSLNGGRVTAYTLEWRPLKALQENAVAGNAVEEDYINMIERARESDREWLVTLVHALVSALDVNATVTYAEAERFADSIIKCADDGKEVKGNVGDFAYFISCTEDIVKAGFVCENVGFDGN